MAEHSLVQVVWEDAYFELDDTSGGDEHTYQVTTVGWLIDEGAKHVRIAAETLPDGRYRGITRIPRALVLEVRKLRVA